MGSLTDVHAFVLACETGTGWNVVPIRKVVGES